VLLGHRYAVWENSVPIETVAAEAFDLIKHGLEPRA